MAAPGHAPYNTAAFWDSEDVLDLFFPHFTYGDARNLMRALGLDLPFHHYSRCNDLMCNSSSHPSNRLTLVRSWVSAAPQHHANYRLPCGRRATFFNKATGYREPSFCQEPHNYPPPAVPGGPVQHANGFPRVCPQCKDWRADDWDWRMRELKFGVCALCRNWALKNIEPGQDNCTCPGVARWTGDVNNNEPRYKHLCTDHDGRYWRIIFDESWREIGNRLRLKRRRQKKRGHGWTRRKGPKAVHTPLQRRQRTHRIVWGGFNNVTVIAGPPMAAHPKCYCGETISLDMLSSFPSAAFPGPANENNRVRSCVGCNGFLRRW